MKILITGGHVTPALAVIDEIKNHEIVFVGRQFALSNENTESFEYKEITARGIRFINLVTGRLNRSFTLEALRSLLLIPRGFFRAEQIIRAEKPDIVLSFGSYLAVPIAFWAHRNKIPVFTHEQTIQPGLANRLISRWAKKVFISFPQSRQFFPAEKVVQTGNPVRKSILKVAEKPFHIPKKKPVVYITGGSLGSHSINMHVKSILDELKKEFFVIHQTGDTKTYNDYDRLAKYADESYMVRKHVGAKELAYIYDESDIVVCRAGANTVFELIAMSKPSIFIPLPWSGHDEQRKQAKLLKDAHVALIFEQSRPSIELLDCIRTMAGDVKQYSDFSKLKTLTTEDASRRIYEEILKA
ncbi:UDP-N-acetylglucosamine--N-acetylmuramyl-(pentapeptide) pyrophosphoryl-undecaprenol N-acetylglucosamine transferase [Candidatus Microgenomates bacterium]|nr:UDP-N-acetylglucosamine--N-acetylmuramyl-(pentapeptide) pyrophosphoryl-undecaprenol N-acetylglucosamine transferase [Candidatus Microgenomates bacterium]